MEFDLGGSIVKYDFSLQMNVFMYNHLITCSDGVNKYSCICESSPTKNKTIIFWPLDFGLDEEETRIVTEELKFWCTSESFECQINSGHGR